MSDAIKIKVHNRRCRVCRKGFTRDLVGNQHIPDNHACSTCQHWVDQFMTGGGIIVNRNHYRTDWEGGMNTPVRIEFFDGRVEYADHIWHQGAIPAQFDIALPDNARMELTV